MSRRFALGIAVLLVLTGCGERQPTSEWPSFRGPRGVGVSEETGLPEAWSEDGGVVWKSEIPGYGSSAPIVSNDRVFVTSARRVGDRDVGRFVVAFDFGSGELLWEQSIVTDRRETKHRLNTHAAPSAVTDSERLFVYFGSTLAALNLEGSLLWKNEIDPDYHKFSRYGAGSSPVVTADAVIVLQDREYANPPRRFVENDLSWIAAFAKDDGRELWRTHVEETCCTYSTPVVVDRGAGEEILVAFSGLVASFSAETGELLWRHEYRINQNVSSPVLDGDLLVVAGGAHSVRLNVGMRLTGAGGRTSIEELWSDVRLAPQTSSPVLYRGMLFAVTDRRVMVCRDAENGEVLWEERLDMKRNHASLVAGDDKVYVGPAFGRTAVVEAAPEFNLLAMNDVYDAGRSIASPALAGGSVVLRTRNYLYRIAGSAPGSP